MHIFDACSSMANFQALPFARNIYICFMASGISKHDVVSVILREEDSLPDIEKLGRASNEEYRIKVRSIKTNPRDRTFGINHNGN